MGLILRQPKLRLSVSNLWFPIHKEANKLASMNYHLSNLQSNPPGSFLKLDSNVQLCQTYTSQTNPSTHTGWLEPYLQVTRIKNQIGTLLLFWPCSWSITMASSTISWSYLGVLSLFGTGAFLMRGAGCIINDYLDQNFDRQVVRTKGRPFARRAITTKQGLAFTAAHFTLASLILFQFNWYTIGLGFVALGTAVTYPLMKRIIDWPQLYLGTSFSFGALMGWSVIQGNCFWPVCLPLYVGSVAWTVFYDTIYAYQDYQCDKEAGVKSSAVTIGDYPKASLAAFAVVMESCLISAGLAANMEWPYYLGVLCSGAHLAHQTITLNIDDSKDCRRKFESNSQIGYIILAGILGSMYLKNMKQSDESVDLISNDE